MKILKGQFLYEDKEGYKVYMCPFCSKEYALGGWFFDPDGILEDVPCGCGSEITIAEKEMAVFEKEL